MNICILLPKTNLQLLSNIRGLAIHPVQQAGTTRKLTVHETPEHNGAKRLNQTILKKVRAMLHESDLLKFLWAEATAYTIYLKNQTWTRTLGDTTPYEVLNGRKPKLSNLHSWSCMGRVHDTGGSKLDRHSKTGHWMGFDTETKDGHRIYWSERRIVTVEKSITLSSFLKVKF